MNILKKILIIFSTYFFLFSISNSQIANKIVVSVDNEIITEYDIKVENEFFFFINQSKKRNVNIKDLNEFSYNNLLIEKIKKITLSKIANSKINKEMIDHQLENVSKKYGYDSLELLVSNINQNKYFDFNNLKEKIEIELKWNELIYNKYIDQVMVDKKKLITRVEKIAKKNLINEYFISEIFISGKNREILESKKNNVIDSLKLIGFKDTAIKYSEANTAINSGEIGWVKENLISSNVNEIVKNLKIGEYSKPIMKNNGYMFLKINDKRQKKAKINKDIVLKNLMNEEKDRILNQFSLIYFNQLKNNSVIIKR